MLAPAPIANSEPETPSAEHLFTPGRFALFLGVLILAAWPDVLFGSGSFVLRDFSVFGYPIAHYHRECFWRGELPLWNPLNNCGIPFLAQWNTMTLYPGSLCYLLLPLPWSLGIFMLLHLWLGGLGAYALARRWTQLNFAAALAGVAFAFHGLMQQSLMWPNNIAAFALFPWVLLTVESGIREGGRKLVVAALVGALQMLTGAPEVILFTWLLAGALVLLEGRRQKEKGKSAVPPAARPAFAFCLLPSSFAAAPVRFGAIVTLVAALSAAQLLPFLDLLQHSQRDAGFGGSAWSLPTWGAAYLVAPTFQSSLSSPGLPFQSGQKWTASFYAGLPILALALAALRRGNPPHVWLLASVVVLGLAGGMGENGWLYPALKQLMPLGAMRFPAKFVIPLTLVLPLLAALALRDLLAVSAQPPVDTAARRRLGVSAIGLLAISVALTVYGSTHPLPGVGAASQRLLLVGSVISGIALLLSVGAVLGLARAATPTRALLLGFGLLAVIVVDLKTHLPQLTPRVPPAIFHGNHPLVQPPDAPRLGGPRASITAQSLIELNRTLLPSLTDTLLLQRVSLCANLNLLDGIAKTDGFFSLQPRAQYEVEPHLLFSGATNSLPAPFADFLGVAHVTSPTNIFQWHHRTTALPLITAGQRPVFAAAAATLPALSSTNWNPAATVFLHPWDQTKLLTTNATTAKIVSTHWTARRTECEVDATAPTVVVIAQTFYHPWTATVNGQPTEILRANHAYQAVPVPAGRSTVRLEYVDRRFQLGVAFSALGLVACCVLWGRAEPSTALIANH